MCKLLYKTESLEAEIPVKKYIEEYVDVETFLKACKQCHNYNNVWSCPEYTFDVLDYWKQFSDFKIRGTKIIFLDAEQEKKYTSEEMGRMARDILQKEKDYLTEYFLREEKKYPGSISLSAGSCSKCGSGNCTRKQGAPCRFPDEMRYSIEALGGNVGMTAEKLLGVDLKWKEEGRLPEYFVLVCGLLVV